MLLDVLESDMEGGGMALTSDRNGVPVTKGTSGEFPFDEKEGTQDKRSVLPP